MTSLTSAREIAAGSTSEVQETVRSQSQAAEPQARRLGTRLPPRGNGEMAQVVSTLACHIGSLRSLTQTLSVPRYIFPKMAHYAFTSHESVSVIFPQDTIGMGGNGGDLAVHRGG